MSKRFSKILFTISVVGSLYSYTPAKSSFKDIDSLKNDISKHGFIETSLYDYIFYLVNNPININTENSFLKKLDLASNEQNLARIILLKKANKFDEAYNLAIELLNRGFNPYLFYEELVFLAQVNNKLKTLKKKVGKLINKKFISGLINFKEGNYAEAKNTFSEIINEDKSREVYYWLAYSERYLGNYQDALVNLNEIASLINRDDPFNEKVQNALGGLYYLSGEYEKAEKIYKDAFNKALKNGNNVELIKANINLAIIDDEFGEIYEARKKLSTAQLLAEEINALDLLAIVHSELGVSYTYDTQLTKAEAHYSEALEIFKSINESGRLSLLYNNLGKIYLTLFNYRLALEYFNYGLEYAGDNIRGQILNLTQIADVYTNLANYSDALKYYQIAKGLSKQIKEISMEFDIEMGLGMLDFNLGKFSESLEVFKNAKKIIKEDENPYLFAEAEHKIGIAYHYLDSLQLAEKFLISSMNVFKKYNDIYSQLLVEYDLADLWIKTNQFKKAKNILNNKNILESYELDYLLSLNYLFNSKAAIEEMHYNDAKDMLNKALSIGEKIGNDNLIIEALYSLAKLHYLIDNKNHVENLFANIREKIESRSLSLINSPGVQISYYASFDEIYNTIFNFYIDQNNSKKALEVLDISRSRNTMQNITYLKLNSINSTLLKNFYETNWKLNSSLFSNEEKDSLKILFHELQKEILTIDPELKKYLTPAYSKTVPEIQKELDDSTYFLSINTTDKFTHLFLVGAKTFKYIKQKISRDEIIKYLTQISPYYSQNGFSDELIFNKDLFSFNVQKANEFYNKLFKNIFEQIGRDNNLVISASSDLLNFPIESLASEFNENSSPYNFSDAKFLVQDYNITYTPSANIYLELENKNSSTVLSNLLVGDPIVSSDDFYINFRSSLLRNSKDLNQIDLNPLEYSKEEIQSINSIVGNSVNFISQEATESNFKKFAPKSNLVHISSHSFLLNDQPFIVFSKSDEENGFLEIGEILQLKLNADLVVLSSCKSGLGEVDKREGILGMQKSFFDAGARSIVVSLWDVSDKYTYLFMELFYKNLKKGLNKSHSLKVAKQDFIKQYSPNPYYWAAFVLAGNTQSIEFKNEESQINLTQIFVLIFIISLVYFGRKLPGMAIKSLKKRDSIS